MVPVIATQVLIARSYAADDFGAFGIGLAVASVASILVPLGATRALPLLLAERDQHTDRPGFVGAILFNVILILGASALGWILTWAATSSWGFASLGEPSTQLTLLLFATGVFEALDRLAETTCAVLGVVRSIVWRKYVVGPGLRMAAVVLALVLDWSIVGLGVAYVVASTIGSVLYFAIVARAMAIRPNDLAPSLRRFDAGLQLRRGLQMLIHGALMAWIAAGGTVLVGAMDGPGEAAILRAALPLAIFTRGLVVTFGITFSPLMARAATAGDTAEISRIFWRYALWVTVLIFPIGVLLSAFPVPVLDLAYGDRYLEADWTLRLVGAGFFLHAATGFHAQAIQMMDRNRPLVRSDVVVFVVFTVLNLVLIPPYGALGAAIAIFVGLILSALWSLQILFAAGMSRPSSRIGLAFAGVLATLVGFALVGLGLGGGLVALLAAVAATGLAALALFWYALPELDLPSMFPFVRRIPLLGPLIVRRSPEPSVPGAATTLRR